MSKERFIFIDSCDTIILSDYNYWAANQERLTSWCESYNAKQQGSAVKLNNKSDISLFSLIFAGK